MGILCDSQIIDLARHHGLVEPFDETLVNPASLDLRIVGALREPHPVWSYMSAMDMKAKIVDGSIEHLPRWGDPIEFDTYWLMPPGKGTSFVLCSSLEVVNLPPGLAALLFSKSSVGRIGLEHLHAGYGDPGWRDSQWTWELHNVAPWPIKLEAGKPLMQQVMIRMDKQPDRDYRQTGRYNGQRGPTPAL